MLIAGIDFESTGSEPEKDRITEIGAILWDKEWNEVDRIGYLVYADDYPEQTQEIIDLTGITTDDLKKSGVHPKEALENLTEFITRADHFVAHYTDFDRNIYEAECARYQVEVPKKDWICSYREVPYPDKLTCKKLAHLALDHGVVVNPEELHRAVGDVALIGQLMKAGGYTIESILAYKNEPWVYLKAIIPPPWTDGGVGKKKATDRGYGWQKARGTDGPEFTKAWVKRVKESQLEEELAQAPFKTEILRKG